MTADEQRRKELRDLDVAVHREVLGLTCRPSPDDEWVTDDPLATDIEGKPFVVEIPSYSADIAAAWPVWVRGLALCGEAAVLGDVEDYFRGTIIRGRAEEAVTVRVGDHVFIGPVCEAVCRATLAAVRDGRADP